MNLLPTIHFDMIEHILKYFPSLQDFQKAAFEKMMALYPDWNDKINVISRKDIENLEINHILHSLSIAKFTDFKPGSKVLDFGTGGGFPGIPLAVMFPETEFTLIDRTGKKLKVAADIAEQCGLRNVKFIHGDVAECKDKFDFVVSRAVMPQKDLLKICRKNIAAENKNALPNGLITLKGGDLQDEMKGIKSLSEEIALSSYFDEPFFETKKILFTPA